MRNCLYALVLVLLVQAVYTAYTWQSVAVGGGGYVLNVLPHPKEQNLLYARTDVGGLYRFDHKWIPLTEKFNYNEKNYYGGESFAVDYKDTSVIWWAGGMYPYWGNGDIFKSNDRGSTWRSTGLKLLMGGNEDVRWGGERLQVDPLNSERVYFGSRYDGLWKFNGDRWSLVSSLPSNGTKGYGVVFVALNPAEKGTEAQTIYVGVYDVGIYISTNSGQSWRFLGGPKQQIKGLVSPGDGSLYVTANSGVFRLYPSGDISNITPNTDVSCAFSALTIDPKDPRIVIVSHHCNVFWETAWRSRDEGRTWNYLIYQKMPSLTVHKSSVPWWSSTMFASATSSIVIDPFNTEKLYLTDWFGTWFTDNSSTVPIVWYTYEYGHEEVFGITLHCTSDGGLLSGTADVDGFKHTSLTQFPEQFSGLVFQDTTSIDSSDIYPSIVVRVGTIGWSTTGGAGISKDGGAVYTPFPKYPVENNYNLGGEIAISPDTKTIVWRPFLQYPYYTTDQGNTWTVSKGAPKSPDSCCHNLGIDAAYNTLLVADRRNSSVFYIYNAGEVFVSFDGAINFVRKFTIPGFNSTNHVMMQSVPYSYNAQGEVWVSTDFGGLWRSSDFGTSWTKIPNVERSLLFAFGKNDVGKQFPAVYLMGQINGIDGIFVSYDSGVSFTNIQQPSVAIGDNPWSMCADKSIFGRVFIGTLGRGIYFGDM